MGKSNRKSKSKDNTAAAPLEPTHACVAITHYFAFAKEKRRKVYPPIIDHKLIRQDVMNERIHIVDSFLLEDECLYFINTAERMGFEECEQAASKEYAHRNNGRIQIDDSELACQIYDRLLSVLPPMIDGKQPCGCSSNIRLYRYTAGQSFGKHIDESHYDDRLGGTTKYTLLVYLNSATSASVTADLNTTGKYYTGIFILDYSYKKHHIYYYFIVNSSYMYFYYISDKVGASGGVIGGTECMGGETAFYKGVGDRQVVAEIVPQTGRLLLHGHGSHCLTHEGRPVLSGVKYLLRTDVVYR